jgi:hypothetical protein
VPARIHVQPALPKSQDGRISLDILKAAAQVAGHSEPANVEGELPQFLVPQS